MNWLTMERTFKNSWVSKCNKTRKRGYEGSPTGKAIIKILTKWRDVLNRATLDSLTYFQNRL